ncbi:MAG: hypothetical protein KPEEDBHJ_03212 [Anaerolineales bacterium]|nr:hypothetical protein [Anaerolineales bacterium]
MNDASRKSKKPGSVPAQRSSAPKLNDAVRESELRYRRLFETARDGILIADAATGKIEDANPYLLDLLGYTRDEAVKKKAWQLYADSKAAKKNFDALRQKDYIRFDDLPMKGRDGRLAQVECVCNAYQVGGSGVVQVNIRDIAERIRATEALTESELRFRSMIENSQDAIALLDASGRLVYESPSGLRITGFSPEERIGGSAFDLLHPDDLDKVRGLFGQIVKRRRMSVSAQARTRRKDGEWRWLDITAINLLEDRAVGAVVINYRDITEQKLAEDTLRENAGRLEGLFENSPIPIWEEDFSGVKQHLRELGLYGKSEEVVRKYIHNNPDIIGKCIAKARVINVNHACLALFNAPDKRALMDGVENLVAEGSLEALREQIVAVAVGKKQLAMDSMVRTLDGRLRHVHVHWSVMPGYEKSLARVIVSTEDITDRKETEAALRTSEVRFRAFTGATGEGVVFHERGMIVDVNPALVSMFGYEDISEMVGRGLLEFVAPESRDLVLQKVQSGSAEPYEAFGLRKDGTTFAVEASGRMYEYRGRNLRVASIRDVTERKKAEKLLKNLSLAIDASGDVLFMTDREGVILSINAQFTDLYGYTPEEVVGKTTPRILKSGKQEPEVYERLWRIILRGELFRGEMINRAKDGRLISIEETVSPFFDAGGNISGFLAIQRNIADRRQAEESLRLAEAKYRALIENIPALVYMDEVNETGASLYISPQSEALLGYPPSAYAENPLLWQAQIHPDDYPRAAESIRRTLQDGRATAEYRIKTLDGRWIWGRDLSTLIRGEDGQPQFIQGIIEDITAQKQAEEKIAQNLREMTALHNIGQKLNSDISLDQVVRAAVDGIAEAVRADIVMFFLADGTELRVRGFGPADSKLRHNPSSTLRVGECLCGLSVREKKPVYSADIHNDMRCTLAHCKQAGLRSFASLPLTSGDEILGALGIASVDERDFEKQSLFLEAIAVSASISLRNALFYEKARNHAAELEKEIAARGQAEQALIKSEKDYRDLFNNAGDAIVIFELEGEIILQANATACRLYGFERDELLGRSLKDLTKNIGRGEDYLKAFIRGEASSIFESVHVNRSGEDIQVLINCSLIEYAGKRSALALIRDATELKRTEGALRRSEARLAEAQKIARLGNWEWNVTLNTVLWSDEIFRIFGLNKADVDGSNNAFELFLGTVHPDDREAVNEAVRKALQGIAPYNMDHRILLPDGSVKFVHEQAVVVRDEAGKPARLIGISQDITERKQAEKNLQRQFSHLGALREIDKIISSGFDMRQNLTTLLMHAVSELNADAASILLLNPNLNRLEYAAGYGFRARGITKTNLLTGEGYAGQAVIERRLVRVDALPEQIEQFSRASFLAEEKFVCYFGMPLVSKGVVKGVLEIFHRSPLDPDQDWLDFLHTLAGQAAIAIENAQLFNNLQQSNFELLHAYDATIEGWSRALDLRDRETEGHTKRVTDMAIRLGKKFGLSDEELKYMRWGGLLHDIGKMGVPDAILFKKESLTPEEMSIMRRHTLFAYEMLSPIRYLKDAVDIPYCHHEKWDGTGYPRGLRDAQIPFSARIFAVADVYDAVTSDRPYRDKWEKEKAIAYIRENTGSHFDPAVTEVFLRMIKEDGEENPPT